MTETTTAAGSKPNARSVAISRVLTATAESTVFKAPKTAPTPINTASRKSRLRMIVCSDLRLAKIQSGSFDDRFLGSRAGC